MVRNLFIVGTGGLAREMAQLVLQINTIEKKWHFSGFISETEEEIGRSNKWGSVVADDKRFLEDELEADVIIGIGHPAVRKKICETYRKFKERLHFPNIIHPKANFETAKITIGMGNVITCGCTFTTDITLADFNLFNLHSTVGHDAIFGSYNVINPSCNISGSVEIGSSVLLGTGCQILESVKIGSGSRVGAGAVVTKDVKIGTTVVGIPARQLAER